VPVIEVKVYPAVNAVTIAVYDMVSPYVSVLFSIVMEEFNGFHK